MKTYIQKSRWRSKKLNSSHVYAIDEVFDKLDFYDIKRETDPIS